MASFAQPPAAPPIDSHRLPPRVEEEPLRAAGLAPRATRSTATATLNSVAGWSYGWLALVIVGLLAPAGLILFWLEPGSYPIYPVCYFHRVTGLLCPACGSLRALHQLLNGHWLMAWRFNPLLVTSLPIATGMAAWVAVRRGRRAAAVPGMRPVWLWLFLAVVLAFGVWRNLPGSPSLPTGPAL